MLSESGRVVAIAEDGLWVETIRRSTCGTCSAAKGCGHGLLNQMGDGRRNYTWVLPGDCSMADFAVDDEVRIAIPESLLLFSSALVYGLPLMSMLVTAVLLSEVPLGVAPDVLAVTGALLGFGLGVVAVRLHAGRHRQDRALQPRLLGLAPAPVTAQPLSIT